MASISSGKMTIVTNDPSQRYYYLMVFNNKYHIKVATRNINIPGIQNFRDLGGYESANTGKSLRWGMIYRSAQIDSILLVPAKSLRIWEYEQSVDLHVLKVNHTTIRNYMMTSLKSYISPSSQGTWKNSARYSGRKNKN